ncbi:hypothetical protein RINTHM_14790 [Richelia intracellularis HM01]|nr:hypothetical protein RINTHM_14790 [Richelia intracellularis HM01]
MRWIDKEISWCGTINIYYAIYEKQVIFTHTQYTSAKM